MYEGNSMDYIFYILCCAIAVLVTVVFTALVSRHRRSQLVNSGVRAVLITGCDRGFGCLLARKLDYLGFKVFAGCLDAQAELAKILDRETSDKLEILQLDVTKVGDIEKARHHITNSLGGTVLWAVVNNAGVAFHSEFEWFPPEDFGRVMDVNFMGVVKVTRAFLPLLRASTGRVINIASMAGRTAMPGFTAYAASKAAVIAFSESLRREMVHFGVKVIVLEPSIYKTDIMNSSTLKAQNEKYWEQADCGIKRDYGNSFFNATQDARDRITDRACPNVEEVIDSFVEAVCSRHPGTRYVTPFSTRVLNDAMNCTFLWLQDYVIYQVMGVRTKPDMMNPQLNVDSGRLGRRRSHAT